MLTMLTNVPDIGSITSLISTLGFPIACCVVMWRQIDKMNERHKEESDKWCETVNNNTNILTKLVERLGGDNK